MLCNGKDNLQLCCEVLGSHKQNCVEHVRQLKTCNDTEMRVAVKVYLLYGKNSTEI